VSTGLRSHAVEAIPGRVIRGRGWSIRIPARALVVCSILAAVTLFLSAVSISVGDFPIPLGEVWATLLGGGTDQTEFIVNTLRLPRVLTAILTGAAFGMSGAIFQSLARNPLGSPDIVGFDSGAAFGAVAVLLISQGSTREAALGAVIGGLATALLVYLLAWKRGVATYRLVLVGIGVGFVVSSAIEYMMTRAEILELQRATVWLTGSLNGRGWDHVATAGISLLVLTPFVLALSGRLNLLELGDDAAAGLGVSVQRSKLALAVVAVLLAALAVASVGPVAFVAFAAGPIARRLVGTPHAAVIPAAFVGAVFMVGADLIARRIIAPTELPVGIATAAIGAPYLLWLITRQIRTGAL
jgi:iron complex transport system permease protein